MLIAKFSIFISQMENIFYIIAKDPAGQAGRV